jgi:hypothetical protein
MAFAATSGGTHVLSFAFLRMMPLRSFTTYESTTSMLLPLMRMKPVGMRSLISIV